MLLFAVFCLAVLIVSIVPRLASLAFLRRRDDSGSRPDGVAFMGAILIATFCGLALHNAGFFHEAVQGLQALDNSVTGHDRGLTSGAPGAAHPSDMMIASWLLLITGALYVVLAILNARGLAPWMSDLTLLLATFGAIFALRSSTVHILRQPVSNVYLELGRWSVPLTALWIWAVARMTATLNRVPQVMGGYLGIVALTLLAITAVDARTSFVFPGIASAALAGAGVATIPFALRRSNFNLGWPAALAAGFMLAQIATVGLLKNTTFAILALLLLALGLPLLDVSFYSLRAALRGQKVAWEEHRLRLHEALLRRGLSPAKIAFLYLAIGVWLCALGAGTARFLLNERLSAWVLTLRFVLLAVLFCGGLLVFFSLTRLLMRRGEDEQIPENIEAFGVRISAVSMTEALDKMEEFIRSRQPHHVVTSDANAILRAQEDEEYAGILRRAALITPDGYGVIWGARLLNLPIYERVTGVDMVTGICERAAKNNYSIYILGSAPGIAATAAQKLMEKYPGLRVAGTQHGYYEKEGVSEEEVVRRIHDAKPDVLFVAFGIPKQEKFIARHFEALDVPVSLGVGGSFDVYSEKLKRAPEYIQRAGMEWLYRVWQEPWRWKRMAYVPRFMAFAVRYWLFGNKARGGAKTG